MIAEFFSSWGPQSDRGIKFDVLIDGLLDYAPWIVAEIHDLGSCQESFALGLVKIALPEPPDSEHCSLGSGEEVTRVG